MLRRLATSTAPVAALASAGCARRYYNFAMFKNPERRPQLTQEQREAVEIDQSAWPEEFRDYDPQNPYKNSPDFIEGMGTWSYFLWGLEAAFIYQFYELVFPKSI